MNWNKREIAPEVVRDMRKTYQCGLLDAAILCRRGVTAGNDLLFFLEDDLRYQHSPFLFAEMEDAVDRIMQAKDEGEKVLVFGDRDADGITGTALMTSWFQQEGVDVRWQVPIGDEAYGLTKEAVRVFAAESGTLIVTVDCGISCREEIALAASLGIDVIVVDHHNPIGDLPEDAVIINPKAEGSGYPFPDISGCAVAYKLVSALRFVKSGLYKQEICLLNVRPLTDAYTVECLKVMNMTARGALSETLVPGVVRIQDTRLLPFLQGQQIFVWDAATQKRQLAKIFGAGVEFNLLDVRPEAEKIIPSVGDLSLLKIKDLSKIVRYADAPAGELDGFFNIFVTFLQKKAAVAYPGDADAEKFDLQLVTLAALADIMPMKNENRIFARQGLQSINNGVVRPGLLELLAKQNLLGRRLGSTELSWQVTPALNAAGRLGQPETAVRLFLEPDAKKREALAAEVVRLNEERKQLGSDALAQTEQQARESLAEYGNKFAVVVDERVSRGITGILAGKLVQKYKVPAAVLTVLEGKTAVGSLRSTRGCNVTALLAEFSDLLLAFGGHDYAAGFSLEAGRLGEFIERLKERAPLIELAEAEEEVGEIDAELPHSYMTPELLKLADRFEPYGHENPALHFLVKGAKIAAADIMGKTERKHLKLTLQCGSYQWPALFWGEAERYGRDFTKGDLLDAVFTVKRETFNGTEKPELILDAVTVVRLPPNDRVF
nr:single-stranded-DNA-specific exonuclease RecJ [Treponema endosymbiont of Eucomonympha sp.]